MLELVETNRPGPKENPSYLQQMHPQSIIPIISNKRKATSHYPKKLETWGHGLELVKGLSFQLTGRSWWSTIPVSVGQNSSRFWMFWE